MTNCTHGSKLTRFDPYFHPTEDGGMNCRTITDDGAVYNRPISRKSALRIMADLALWLDRTE